MAQYAPLASKEDMEEEHQEKEGLLSAHASPSVSGNTDRAFLIAYVVCMVAWLVMACWTLATSPPVLEKDLDPYSCRLQTRRGLLEATADVPTWVLLVVWALAIGLPPVAAKLLVMACTAFPRVLVYGVMYAQLTLFAMLFVGGTTTAVSATAEHPAYAWGVGVAAVGAWLFLFHGIIYFSLRKRLEFVSNMLAPLLVLLGAVIDRQSMYMPNPKVAKHNMSMCTDAYNRTVQCCVLDTEHAPALLTIAGVVMFFWTARLMVGVRQFTIGGVVSDWYFAAPGTVQNTTRKHLRRALTESLGCIAVGALIQALVVTVWGLCNNRVLRFVMRMIEAYVDWLTRYALVYAGMTGMSFFPAARKSHNLLTSNTLEVVSVGLIPGILLWLLSISGSILVGGVVFGVTIALGLPVVPHDSNPSMGMLFGTAKDFGIIAYTLTAFCMVFVAGMVMDVTNAVYLCFALDREHSNITKPQVHEAFATLVAPAGVVVEQPGGDIVYAPVVDVEMQQAGADAGQGGVQTVRV